MKTFTKTSNLSKRGKFVILSIMFISLALFTSASRKDAKHLYKEKDSEMFFCLAPGELYLSNVGSSSPLSLFNVKKNKEYVVWATGMINNNVICITTVDGGTLVSAGCNDTAFGINTALGRIFTGSGSFLTIGVRATCINNEQSGQNSRNYLLTN